MQFFFKNIEFQCHYFSKAQQNNKNKFHKYLLNGILCFIVSTQSVTFPRTRKICYESKKLPL